MLIKHVQGQPWLRGRASVLLLEGRWFNSLHLHAEVSLGKTLNPKLLSWQPPSSVYV